MFTCPYNDCKRTFSGRAALREHTKSHKSQAYWETLNNTSENSQPVKKKRSGIFIFFNDLLFLFCALGSIVQPTDVLFIG